MPLCLKPIPAGVIHAHHGVGHGWYRVEKGTQFRFPCPPSNGGCWRCFKRVEFFPEAKGHRHCERLMTMHSNPSAPGREGQHKRLRTFHPDAAGKQSGNTKGRGKGRPRIMAPKTNPPTERGPPDPINSTHHAPPKPDRTGRKEERFSTPPWATCALAHCCPLIVTLSDDETHNGNGQNFM